MRKTVKPLLALVVLVVVTGAMGASTVLAAPPTSGSPTLLSTYGTIVLGNYLTLTGKSIYFNVYVFSSAGPFYVEKIYEDFPFGPSQPITLDFITYDNFFSYFAGEPTVVPKGAVNGEIIAVAPSTIHDPSGATAIPAATGVEFVEYYGGLNFPSSTAFFEATILAPTADTTVTICANQGTTVLTSCSLS